MTCPWPSKRTTPAVQRLRDEVAARGGKYRLPTGKDARYYGPRRVQ